jgi:hypothetical protein
MNDSSSSGNRWKRAERHPEKHQILMQSLFLFFGLFFSVDRQFLFFVTNLYIYEQCDDVQENAKKNV